MKINNRRDLACHFGELGFKTGAEIGVLGGGYSIILNECIPGLRLYAVDSWGINEVKHGPYHARKYEEAKKRLAIYPNTILIKNFSLEAVKDFGRESLDFVYIDANHKFDFIMRDIIEWGIRVKKGGVIAGHDYANTRWRKIKDVVDLYASAHHLSLNLTSDKCDHGVISWWFLKK